jgi:hypothetical protein
MARYKLAIISLNNINHTIFVTVTGCVLFEVRTQCLECIKMSSGFKGLIEIRPIIQSLETFLVSRTLFPKFSYVLIKQNTG